MCRFRARTFRERSSAGLQSCDSRAATLIRCATAGLLLLTCACGRASRSPLDDAADRYVRLAVALGERDPDSLDFYAGAVDRVSDIRNSPPPLTQIKRDADALSADVSRVSTGTAADTARASALVADLSAISARVSLLTGTRQTYNEESVAFFGIAPEPLDERRMNDIRSQIAGIIGPEGRLVHRYAAFVERFVIPADRLPAVMNAALEECRSRTLAHLALPPGEVVTIEFVRDKPWSAFSRYLGNARSRIQINTDFLFTVDQALQIACHEGYPGHHTRNTLMTSVPVAQGTQGAQVAQVAQGAQGAQVAQGFSLAVERSVQLMFSPEALVSEASAMLAADVAFSPDERIRVERDRLFPLAGLDPAGAEQHIAIERLVGELQSVQADVARRYVDGELEFSRAVTALEQQALVPYAEAMLKYVNEYRSYVTTYTTGRDAFAARLAACADATGQSPWRCFEGLMLKRGL